MTHREGANLPTSQQVFSEDHSRRIHINTNLSPLASAALKVLHCEDLTPHQFLSVFIYGGKGQNLDRLIFFGQKFIRTLGLYFNPFLRIRWSACMFKKAYFIPQKIRHFAPDEMIIFLPRFRRFTLSLKVLFQI